MFAALWILTFLASFTLFAFFATEYGQNVWVWIAVALCALGADLAYIALRPRQRETAGGLWGALGQGVYVLLPLLFAATAVALPLIYGGLDIRLKQGILTGLIVVLGWIATFLFQEVSRERDARERERDLLIAIEVELERYLVEMEDAWGADYGKGYELKALLEQISADTKAGRKTAVPEAIAQPFFITPSSLLILDANIDRLKTLDAETLQRVLWFYAQYVEIAQFAKDLQSPAFGSLSLLRRCDMQGRYIEGNYTAITLAGEALERIKTYRTEKSYSRPRIGRTPSMLDSEANA